MIVNVCIVLHHDKELRDRERETDTDRQTHRQTDRQTDTQKS